MQCTNDSDICVIKNMLFNQYMDRMNSRFVISHQCASSTSRVQSQLVVIQSAIRVNKFSNSSLLWKMKSPRRNWCQIIFFRNKVTYFGIYKRTVKNYTVDFNLIRWRLKYRITIGVNRQEKLMNKIIICKFLYDLHLLRG